MSLENTDMLPDSVESEIFQHLQIIYHRILGWGDINAVGPEALVQGSKHEDEFTVQQRSNDTVDSAFGDSTESSIALDLVLAECDRDIIQLGGVG